MLNTMIDRLRVRQGELPKQKTPPADPDLTDDAPRPFQYPRPVLQEPRVFSLAAGTTIVQNFSFTPDLWHVATPNGEYVLVSPGAALLTASAWVLGRGGFVAFPGMGSVLTVENTGTAAATVIITPLNSPVKFAYDPGWGV